MKKGNYRNQKVTRKKAHQLGLYHRASHIWIFRRKKGKMQVLLQQRSAKSEVFPSCLDISSAGHVRAGESYEDAAMRELKEELGLDVNFDDLKSVGYRKIVWDGISHGLSYHDRHISKIFLLFKDVNEKTLHLDKNEVVFVKWMDWKEYVEGVRHNTIVHDIQIEELDMLENLLKQRATSLG